jgi:hypothetical protein
MNNAYGLPIQGSSMDFVPRVICFRVFGSSKFPNNKIHGCKHKENHRSASTEIKSSLFIADIKHP